MGQLSGLFFSVNLNVSVNSSPLVSPGAMLIFVVTLLPLLNDLRAKTNEPYPETSGKMPRFCFSQFPHRRINVHNCFH